MDKLETYIQQNSLTKKLFASKMGLSQSTIVRYLKRQRFPNRETILKIAEVTNGYIRPEDWYVDNTVQPSRSDIVAQKDEGRVNND